MARWIERRPDWLNNKNSEDAASFKKTRKNIYGVLFIPLRCPRCNSKKVKCYGSYVPIRYHRCRECGHNFKSIEKDYDK